MYCFSRFARPANHSELRWLFLIYKSISLYYIHFIIYMITIVGMYNYIQFYITICSCFSTISVLILHSAQVQIVWFIRSPSHVSVSLCVIRVFQFRPHLYWNRNYLGIYRVSSITSFSKVLWITFALSIVQVPTIYNYSKHGSWLLHADLIHPSLYVSPPLHLLTYYTWITSVRFNYVAPIPNQFFTIENNIISLIIQLNTRCNCFPYRIG